jgi:SAM-dependent methyltransferase
VRELGSGAEAASTEAMRAFWDARARENAMYYIHTHLDFRRPDPAAFWESGVDNLDRTLALFGDRIGPTDRVLEIGCGVGRITRAIAERAGLVVGLDVSAEMIRRARAALSDLTNVELVLGDGRGLSGLPDAAFDAVYSFLVFQHVPDPAVVCAYVRDIGRVLRPGGWTLFQVSERPEVHRPESYPMLRGLRARLRQWAGLAPRGGLAPQWLGAAVDRADLLGAIADGGLVLDGTVGDGTQFCFVRAHRP